jgi:RNA polymerase sigma-70 factor, ECF subfamily
MDLDRLWDGDAGYFAELMASGKPLVDGVVRAYARDEDHAKDLSQQVWLTVYMRRESYLGEGSFPSWLRRLATRVCIRDRRNTRAREQTLQSYRDALKAHGSLKYEPNPLAGMERDEALALIFRVLPDLSRREQETMELLILQKTSPGEAAEIMGVKASTVRSHLRHALTRLRTLLEGEEP